MDEKIFAQKVVSLLDANTLPSGVSTRLMRARYAAVETHRQHLVRQGNLLLLKFSVPQILAGLALLAGIFILNNEPTHHIDTGHSTSSQYEEDTGSVFQFLEDVGLDVFAEDAPQSNDGL